MIRCDKESQVVIRCHKIIVGWKLILELPNENNFVSNLGDKV